MIRFYLTESIKSITRAKLASFFAVVTLSISIMFITTSFALIFLSNKIENSWKSEIKVNLFINDSIESEKLSQIKSKIVEFKEVADVNFISKQEAYKKFVEMTGEDFSKILETNPLPRSYTISFNNNISKNKITQIISKLQKIEGVDDVIYDYNLTFTILESIKSMRIIIFFLTILFTLIAIYLLFSTSKLVIAQKIEQYNIMKLVGAKLNSIKIPLLINGFILGIISSLICIIIFNVLYFFSQTIYPNIRFDNYLYFINFVFVFLGIILGPLGIGFFTKKLSLKVDETNIKK
ncbi:MAG: hypothetical protein COW71_02330 [Ignavibacteriales bacterium CG18_big_fil_WC_8_21_14_2_50_31_20]|nr:MAG: hypothetical protein COW71_02330 [Ignavibacteriales bacterium CG18_big_fil_WC_8_21_14_2_50_31_20]